MRAFDKSDMESTIRPFCQYHEGSGVVSPTNATATESDWFTSSTKLMSASYESMNNISKEISDELSSTTQNMLQSITNAMQPISSGIGQDTEFLEYRYPFGLQKTKRKSKRRPTNFGVLKSMRLARIGRIRYRGSQQLVLVFCTEKDTRA
jgi:hypothetical protein